MMCVNTILFRIMMYVPILFCIMMYVHYILFRIMIFAHSILFCIMMYVHSILFCIMKEAQALGFAEADPTADVEGHDVQAKIALLAKLAFG